MFKVFSPGKYRPGQCWRRSCVRTEEMFRLIINSRQQDLPVPFDSMDGNGKPIPASRTTDESHIEYAISTLDKASVKNGGVSRKRKRSHSYERAEDDSEIDEVGLEAQSITFAAKPMKKKFATRFESIKLPGLVFPQSAYQGHDPTLAVNSERDVLQDLSVGCP